MAHEAKWRVRIRVSWQEIRTNTCLMAERRRSDTCLMAGSFVPHGRKEAFGYVSHGRFVRASWQISVPKSMIYKPLPILQNTKTVVTKPTTGDRVLRQD